MFYFYTLKNAYKYSYTYIFTLIIIVVVVTVVVDIVAAKFIIIICLALQYTTILTYS